MPSLLCSDVVIYIPSTKKMGDEITYIDLRDAGNRMFDSVMYLTSDQKTKFKPGALRGNEDKYENDPEKEAEAFCYVYFCLLLRGRIPSASHEVPNLLTKTFNLRKEPRSYVETLASFDINLLDNSWIKNIDISIFLGLEDVRDQLSTDMVGHRLLNVFRDFYPDKDGIAELMPLHEQWSDFAAKGPHWDIHP